MTVSAIESRRRQGSAPTDESLLAPFAAVFERLRASAAERERERVHPLAEVKELRELGFGALRLPRELGGHGASLSQLFRLLTELGTADSSLPQALRMRYQNNRIRCSYAARRGSRQQTT